MVAKEEALKQTEQAAQGEIGKGVFIFSLCSTTFFFHHSSPPPCFQAKPCSTR